MMLSPEAKALVDSAKRLGAGSRGDLRAKSSRVVPGATLRRPALVNGAW